MVLSGEEPIARRLVVEEKPGVVLDGYGTLSQVVPFEFVGLGLFLRSLARQEALLRLRLGEVDNH